VFGLEIMHNLIFGAKIEVQTDQQPLVSIFTKQISDVLPRLQRFLLRAHKYDVIVKYIKGSENKIADALSRVSPLSPRPADVRPEDVIPLHTLTSAMPVNQSCLEAVRTETQKDSALQQVALYVHHGWPLHKADCDPRVSPYWNSRDDVTLEDGILFRSSQMAIPKIPQGKFLELLHKSHLGEEKSLLLARTTIYWPNYTEDIRQAIRNCYACQSTRPSQPKEEIFQHEIPSAKSTCCWQTTILAFPS
jgi:hypothetical protein